MDSQEVVTLLANNTNPGTPRNIMLQTLDGILTEKGFKVKKKTDLNAMVDAAVAQHENRNRLSEYEIENALSNLIKV